MEKQEKTINNSKVKKVAILTNGGDAPGLNAVIRAILKSAKVHGIEVYGYIDGYKGFLENNYVKLDLSTNGSGLLTRGGTIIGTSNSTNLFNLKKQKKDGSYEYVDMSDFCIKQFKEQGFDCLFTLGGDGTQKSARDFAVKGLNIIGIPKTIDNDVALTDKTFGYDTAVTVATDALERLHSTAESHKRIMVLEVMGRHAGWIALASGIAGGADAILIPEIPFDINRVADKVNNRKAFGKEYSIICVAEGAYPKSGEQVIKGKIENKGLDDKKLGGIGERVAKELEELTGLVSRNTVLGYVQRGGTPTASDRLLSSRYGVTALDLAMKGIFKVLVTYTNGKMGYVFLEDVVGDNKEIGAPSKNNKVSNLKKVKLDDELVKTAYNLDIEMGAELSFD